MPFVHSFFTDMLVWIRVTAVSSRNDVISCHSEIDCDNLQLPKVHKDPGIVNFLTCCSITGLDEKKKKKGKEFDVADGRVRIMRLLETSAIANS